MNRNWLLVTVVFLMASVAHAQTRTEQNVANNMAHETIECAAYFTIIADALRNDGAAGTADEYEQGQQLALQRAIILTKAAGLKTETVSARAQIEIKKQQELIDYNIGNISILSSEYGYLCQEVMENPQARIEHWRTKD